MQLSMYSVLSYRNSGLDSSLYFAKVMILTIFSESLMMVSAWLNKYLSK